MIRLIEEPIAYNKKYNMEDMEVWLYKNPTEREVDELKEKCESVRACTTSNNDYYVGSSYYFTHVDISKMARIYYVFDLVIFFKSNVMSVYCKDNDLSRLKPVYDKMIGNGLINKNTIIINAYNAYDDRVNVHSPKLLDNITQINVSEITGDVND